MKDLLDTNACIHFLAGNIGVIQGIRRVGRSQCCISEITLAELRFGIHNSSQPQYLAGLVDGFTAGLTLLPVAPAVDEYGKQKARLRKSRKIIEDFDLLIGAAAIPHDLVLVTNNVKHLGRLENIRIEDWKSQP